MLLMHSATRMMHTSWGLWWLWCS